MNLWKRYLMGMLSGAGSVVIKTGLNILVIPALISQLGLDAFGLYILLIAIFEVSTLLDLGASNALVTLLGSDQNSVEGSITRRGYLKAGHWWFSLLSILFLAGGLVLLPYFSTLFNITGSLEAPAQIGFLFIILESALTLYSCYFQSVLLAHCSHQWTNIADSVCHVIANVGALAALFLGHGLEAVMGIRLLAAVLRLLFLIANTWKVEADALFPKVPINKDALSKLARLSGHAMMINFSIIVSHKIDDIVIAAFLPISAVGIYEIVFRFLGLTIQICLKLHEGAYPLFSKMAALAQKADARQLFLRMSAFLNMAACLMLMLIVVYYPNLFALFSAGKIPVEQTWPVVFVAVPCILSGVLQMPANAWLFNWGHQRYVTVTSILAAVANLILSLLLVKQLGIVGVALGTLIPQLVQHQAGLILKTCRELQITLPQYIKTVHGAILLPLLVSFTWVQCWKPLLAIAPWPLLPLVLTGTSAGLLGFAIWFKITATPLEKQVCHQIYTDKLLPLLQQVKILPASMISTKTASNLKSDNPS